MFLFDSEVNDVSQLIDFSNPLHIAILVVAALIILVSIWALGVSIYLAIKYVSFNKKQNSAGLTGESVARKILDDNDLRNIKVSQTGSLLFGNSYSHYFHKIRLRRRTWQKTSVSSMAMATQKSMLAIMDKEGDKDMRTRVILTPIAFFGPLAFVPMIIIGLLLDIFVFKSSSGICTAIFTGLGFLFYLVSFILQIFELRTEKKAQEKAYDLARKEGLANEEEIEMMKKLFKLYNIEYINNIILAMLEIIWRILMFVADIKGSKSLSKN